MAGAGAGAQPVAYTSMNFIVDIFTIALRITQLYGTSFIGSAYEESGELVFHDLSVTDKSVTCLKLFVTAYHATHTEGSEPFGYVCLLGICLHWYAIAAHLDRNYKAWTRARIIGNAFLLVDGVFLLCLGMVVPKDHAWHNTVVHAIILSLVFLDAGLFIRDQIKEDVGNKHLLHDMLIIMAETLITIYRFVDSIAKTHIPWDAEKILHLVSSGLPVLIGACQIGWIVYKAGIISKVVEWLGMLCPVFVKEEDQAVRDAMEDYGGGDAGEQVAKDGVEVVVASLV